MIFQLKELEHKGDMMPLTEQQLAVSKQKAIDFLEVSIETSCLALGVSSSELSADYLIPVSEDHPMYSSYTSLIHMWNSLQALDV